MVLLLIITCSLLIGWGLSCSAVCVCHASSLLSQRQWQLIRAGMLQLGRQRDARDFPKAWGRFQFSKLSTSPPTSVL